MGACHRSSSVQLINLPEQPLFLGHKWLGLPTTFTIYCPKHIELCFGRNVLGAKRQSREAKRPKRCLKNNRKIPKGLKLIAVDDRLGSAVPVSANFHIFALGTFSIVFDSFRQ